MVFDMCCEEILVIETEMATNCQEWVKKIRRYIDEKNSYLASSLNRDKDVAQRSLQKKISQYPWPCLCRYACL
jgi:hypothetical protein